MCSIVDLTKCYFETSIPTGAVIVLDKPRKRVRFADEKAQAPKRVKPSVSGPESEQEESKRSASEQEESNRASDSGSASEQEESNRASDSGSASESEGEEPNQASDSGSESEEGEWAENHEFLMDVEHLREMGIPDDKAWQLGKKVVKLPDLDRVQPFLDRLARIAATRPLVASDYEDLEDELDRAEDSDDE
jgi:flagellar biosynthesis GTPase FlhF